MTVKNSQVDVAVDYVRKGNEQFMLRTATNKTYLFGLLKLRGMGIWINLLLVASSLPDAFVWHLHSPGWGCPTRGVTNIKPAKGRFSMLCWTGIVVTN